MSTKVKGTVVLIFLSGLGLSAPARPDDPAKLIRKAVELSTLNQPGTKPFHLKAILAPSPSPYKDPNMTGEIEYWWISPSQFKREVRTPGFHQIAIVKDGKEWQKNEGDYFPEWLRETAVALIEPVPNLDEVLKQSANGEARSLFGSTHVSWTERVLTAGSKRRWAAEFRSTVEPDYSRLAAAFIGAQDLKISRISMVAKSP